MKHLAIGTGIFSLQWFVFLVANSLMLPIVVGKIFHMPTEEIVGLIQRMFFVVGLSSLISARFGHRVPIADGPAGIWLGIFILLGQLAASQGTDQYATLQLLEGGMLITGVTVVLIGFSGWIHQLLKVFTPLVTGVYLISLTIQLCGTLLNGMIGASDASVPNHTANAIVSFGVFFVVFALSVWGKGWMKSYAVLIGVIVGWIVYATVNGFGNVPTSGSIVNLPDVFAWGMPKLDGGMTVTAVMVAFILISSVIASMAAMHQVLGEQEQTDRKFTPLDRGGVVAGISNILCSLFSTIGVVPLSISAGFVRLTGQRRLVPFYIACIALIVVSFVPGIYSLLSLLPAQVAYAAMFATFAQMIGIGLISILKMPLDERRLTIHSLSLSLGTGVMFLPQSLFSSLPTIFQYLLSNGVIVGMLVALLLEQSWKPKPQTVASVPNNVKSA
ncbi:purine/pyrimidine permease [Paenibacillus filicis]|uniref:Purine/pyrimidine permease n=1 Tax=Paenibacillus gyeongsangnamensis TaxID=3388067 RepID=A0ABT4QII5_9BACL|nr:purine/pyrimidine permease [Paenibacillus filicis]MCZ8516698.1 purine/pyrimidine permease [Paenibacillus filicis]